MIVLAIALMAGCARERPRPEVGDDFAQGRYEAGLEKLAQAAAAGDRPAKVEYTNRRNEVLQELVRIADQARAAGSLDEADKNYRRALAIDPANARATLGVELVVADRRHAGDITRALEEFNAGHADRAAAIVRGVLAENPDYPAAVAFKKRLDESKPADVVVDRLKTRDNRPVTLQFRDASTKGVFEVLSRQTGINFIFDKDIKSDGKTTIFVQDVPVEQAIDLVLGQNQLARQILSDNMVLVYPNTAAKQKDYQAQVVKTFYLSNVAPKDAESMLKTVLGAKTMYVDEKANVIVLRDDPESVRMAEKLIAAIDVPEAEVMMEVEVLEIAETGLQQLGLAYPSQVVFTPGSTIASAAAAAASGATGSSSSSASSGSGLKWNDLFKQNGNTLGVSALSLTLELLKQDGTTNVLASPRIRARNKEKAKILIGSRVPVITNSVTPTAGGTAVVTGNVQYVEVGLTLEVEPTIHRDDDVAIKVNLEVSSILKEVTVGTSGTLAYQIGTRNANTLLQLKDGETQLLAGLVQDQDTKSASKVPGLGDIPGLGRLFGSHRDQNDKTELVLSITPHIVRKQQRAPADTTEFWYGTESSAHGAPLGGGNAPAAGGGPNAAPAGGEAPVSAPIALPPPAATPAPAPAVPQPPANGGAGADAAPSPQGGAAVAAATETAPTAAAVPRAVPGIAPGVQLDGPDAVHVGDAFDVTLSVAGDQPAGRLRGQVRFDARVLELVGSDVGTVLPQGAAAPPVQATPNGVQVDVAGTKEAPLGAQGSLLLLHMKALTPRPTTTVAAQLIALGPDGVSLGAKAPPALSIAVAK
jgi:general secretion pathway protein D